MKVIGFKVFILVLYFYLDISYCKIILEPKQFYAVSLIKHFFQDDIFPEITNVRVVNFGYDAGNPVEFQILMTSLNNKYAKATLTLSDFNKTILGTSDHFLLLLMSANQVENALQFIDEIASKGLELTNVVIVFSPDFTKERFTKLYNKPQAENFIQIIYAFPSFETPQDDVSFQVNSRTLVFYLENLLLSKLSSTLKLVKFNTNERKIYGTLNMLRRQQKQNMKEIDTHPMKALLYLRPLSVEKNPTNSTEPFTGIDINILKILAESLGSPYICELGRLEEYGTYYDNNTPTRTLTKIQNGIANVAINRYPVVKSGQGIITVPYDHEEFCFIMLMPETQLRMWSILMPFKTSVWISLLLIHIIILAIYIYLYPNGGEL